MSKHSYRVVQLQNGWLVTADHTPLRFFSDEESATRFCLSTRYAEVCPVIGAPCCHFERVGSLSGDVVIPVCDITGHEIDTTAGGPLDDPNPRFIP